jgi:hypothetical protein
VAIKISQFTPISAIATGTIFAVVDPAGPTSFNATAAQIQTFVLGGNAATATKLLNPANINGVAFDGSAGITVAADAGTLTGNTLASGVTASSLTSVGTLTNLTVTNTISGSINGNAATVTNGVYTTDTGTVTNTMLAGSIANNKLSNSSITINGVSISLGGSGTVTASLPIATNSVLGGVIVGTGITVDEFGTISTNPLVPATTSVLGGVIIGSGFSVDETGEITYDTMFHGFSVSEEGDLIYSYTQDTTVSLQDAFGNDIYEDTNIGTSNYSYSMDENGNLIVTFS